MSRGEALDAQGRPLVVGYKVKIAVDADLITRIDLDHRRHSQEGQLVVVTNIYWDDTYGGHWWADVSGGGAYDHWPTAMLVYQAGGLKALVDRYQKGR